MPSILACSDTNGDRPWETPPIPITFGEMQVLLGPMSSCLQRMESTLKELSCENLSPKEAERSKCAAVTNNAFGDKVAASTMQEAGLEHVELNAQRAPSKEKLPAAPVQQAPISANLANQWQGSSTKPQTEAVNSHNDKIEPALEQGNAKDKPPNHKLDHKNTCYSIGMDEEKKTHSLQLLDQMKVDAELECGHMGKMVGKKEKMLINAVESVLICWGSIQEPERHGCLYRISVNHTFQTVCMLAITFNSILVAFMADWQIQHVGQESPFTATVLEVSCLVFFVLELVIRLAVHRCYFFINEDMHWNIFDFVLVAISLVDLFFDMILKSEGGSNVGFMRLLRLMKLARIFRSLRSFRFFKSLITLMESLMRSFISLFWGFVMLFFVLYLFALVFMQALLECLSVDDLDPILKQDIEHNFGSLAKTLVSLYMSVTGGDDWGKYYEIVGCAGSAYSAVYVSFTFILYFALFNVLTGTLVEKAMSSSKPDRADRILNQRKVFAEQRDQFLEIFKNMDQDNTGMISQPEFMQCMGNPAVLAYMASIGVEIDDVKLFFDTVARQISNGNGEELIEVPIQKFVEGCMHMKGTATAIDMQKQLYETHLIHEDIKLLQTKFAQDFQNLARVVAEHITGKNAKDTQRGISSGLQTKEKDEECNFAGRERGESQIEDPTRHFVIEAL